MMPNFTQRARNYVQRSPQCKAFLSNYSKERLIRGIAKLMSEAYREGKQVKLSYGSIPGTCCVCGKDILEQNRKRL